MASFNAHARHLTRVYPVWYKLGEEGHAYRQGGVSPALRAEVMAIANGEGVEVWPLVSNYNDTRHLWDSARVRRVIGNEGTSANHLRRLIELAREDKVQGLDIDFEEVYAQDKDLFSHFTAFAAGACHQAGLKLGMAVHAKSVEPGHPNGSMAQYFAALGAPLDLMQLMVYDFHHAETTAGPIAPPDWGLQVLRHALDLAPRSHLEFGFPVYGYDWKGDRAQPLPWPAWESLVAAHGPARRDPETAELTLRHEGREAWFCDSIANLRKLYQAREAGVNKAAFWVLGSEDPRHWEMLSDFPVPFARV
jgi:spore germination protein YaaH